MIEVSGTLSAVSNTEENYSYSLLRKVAAWGVHAFTMTGVIWALLALMALFHGEIKLMWLWLGIALFVDGIDGSMARKAEVTKVVTWFDGTTLDNVVDYLTWTFIPALFFHLVLPTGPPWASFLLSALIVTSSMFCYCNKQMKAGDYYFVGFPAAWNIVAFYFWVLETPAWANIVITLVIAAMTLVPTAYLHPFRVKRLMAVNITATVLWFVAAIGFVITFPLRHWWQWLAFALSSLWFLAISAWRTVHGIDRYETGAEK